MPTQHPEMQALQMPRKSAVTTQVAGLCALLAFCASQCSDPHASPASADSGGLVFIRQVEGSSELMWVRLSDGSEKALTASPRRNERWPYWSNAGNRLVFQGEAVGGGNSDLLLWRPETGVAVPIRESNRRDERWPTWSPDGKRLVYAFRGGNRLPGIASESMDGAATEILAISRGKDFFFRPSFSPDGSRLVAQRRGPDGIGSNLWILAPNQLPERLTDDPSFFDMKPWFTRDGDRVIFSRRATAGGSHDIAIITLESGETRILASDPDADDHSGRPAPTRDEIAFSSDRNGSYDIYLTDFSGQSVRTLTAFEDRNAYAPRWSPDGERLVITVNSIEATAKTISNSRIVVVDRSGRVELDIPGAMADWMPAW
jgi:Tol biopolymer transport system component